MVFFFFLRKLSLLFSCKRTYLPSPACTGLQFVGEFSSVLICQFSEVEGWCALQRLPSQPWQRGRGLEIKGDCGDCGNQRRQLERRAWKLKQFRNGASFTPTACTLKKCLTCNTVWDDPEKSYDVSVSSYALPRKRLQNTLAWPPHTDSRWLRSFCFLWRLWRVEDLWNCVANPSCL